MDLTENPAKNLAEQRRLLQLDFEEEREAFTDMADRMGVTRMTDRGLAWFPVTVRRTYWNSLNQLITEINGPASDPDAPNSEAASDTMFEYGRQVAFFTLGGDPGAKPRRVAPATVSVVDGNRMAVTVESSSGTLPAIPEGTQFGVMLSFDETSYRAMFEALDRTIAAKGRLGELRDLFHSRRPAEFRDITPMGFSYLNESQQEAVNRVLAARDVAIVHGPPGTGKTTTLVEAIHETLRREPQALVCAQSNSAVDWISEKLLDRGIAVLRLGNPTRVNDKMLSFTYERQFESHPDYPTLWSIRRAIRQLYDSKKNRGEQFHQKIARLRERATELEIRIRGELFARARVIACTLTGSNSPLLTGMTFPTLFIDEAAQALEAACWIAIRRAGRVVFAGDHCQLPPVVKSVEAARGGLGRSLMERIVDNHPEAVTMLRTQYRMHRDIMAFPNRWFYGGAMEAAPEVEFRTITPFDIPFEWVDTSGLPTDNDPDIFNERLSGGKLGRVNPAEAELTLKTLKKYVGEVTQARILDENIDFGIISPYRAQTSLLRHLVKRDRTLRPIRRFLKIDTVDGFQGRECDVVIISMVRSNASGNIGFLRELRRMNVAMTRACMKLIVIGDAATLGRHRFYRELIASATE
ncbi:MAG: AAA domain-containing protein [Clostridium sp.]|nr:AAA domain-containing protein [Clostridium sp.]